MRQETVEPKAWFGNRRNAKARWAERFVPYVYWESSVHVRNKAFAFTHSVFVFLVWFGGTAYGSCPERLRDRDKVV